MDIYRQKELFYLWDKETDEPETQEWRDDLNAEERNFIAALDRNSRLGIARMCREILIREDIRKRYAPADIRELTRRHDHLLLTLQDDSRFDVYLDSQNKVQYLPIETAC